MSNKVHHRIVKQNFGTDSFN